MEEVKAVDLTDGAPNEPQQPAAVVEAVKMEQQDQVMMQTGITSNGLVVLAFAMPVAELGFPPQMAVDLAKKLVEHAIELGYPKPVRLEIGA
jgi:hypothetical protein